MDSDSDRSASPIRNASSPVVAEVDDAAELVALLHETHQALLRERDLSPANSSLTSTVARLRQRVRRSYSPEAVQAVLGDRSVRAMHRDLLSKLSEVEGLAELYEAERMLETGERGVDLLTRLPDWNVYVSLAGKEIEKFDALRLEGSPPTERVVFVGSGPLPLSAIVMHLHGRMAMTCLDLNPRACEASERLLRRLGLEGSITVLPMDGAEFDYRPFRRIVVASLVPNKDAVLERVRATSPEAIVGVRTAEGMKRLIYEAVDEARLSAQGWSIEARTTPEEGLVINSTLFLRRRK